MRMLKLAIAAIAVVMSISACTQQKTGIQTASDAMGATNLNSIEYSGSGSLFGFGQAFVPGERWPRFEQRSYVASVNYQTPAMRLNSVRSQGEHPPRGGAAQPVAADQRAIPVVSGKSAWTEGGAEYWSDNAGYNWWTAARGRNQSTRLAASARVAARASMERPRVTRARGRSFKARRELARI